MVGMVIRCGDRGALTGFKAAAYGLKKPNTGQRCGCPECVLCADDLMT